MHPYCELGDKTEATLSRDSEGKRYPYCIVPPSRQYSYPELVDTTPRLHERKLRKEEIINPFKQHSEAKLIYAKLKGKLKDVSLEIKTQTYQYTFWP